jgi:hypothetical protein
MTLEDMQKIEALARRVREQTQKTYRHNHPDSPWMYEKIDVFIRPGRKYTKIDRGEPGHESGYLMIDHSTLEIFGIKGYGVPHKQHRYGTLDDQVDWYWGNYHPERYNE